MSKRLIIGIRDSGVGGLTVARCIRRVLPNATLLYFADTAHVPYGDRTPDEVRHFALAISQFLLSQGAQLLVFACNTSSAYALDLARQRFTVPVTGMIEPGSCAALGVSTSGRIGVLATQATVDSHVYTSCLQNLKPGTECMEVPCPDFVPLVESEQTCSEAAFLASERYMQPLLKAGMDTVILGCTHYPLLLSALREVAPDVQFVDPAQAVADEVSSLIENQNRQNAGNSSEPSENLNDVFFVSGPSDGVLHWVKKLLPVYGEIVDIRQGPVFDVPVDQ